MASTEKYITSLLHRKGFSFWVFVLSLVPVYFYLLTVDSTRLDGADSSLLPPPDLWFAGRMQDFACSACANAAVVLVIYLINRYFSLLRAPSLLPIAFYSVLQMAVPQLYGQFYSGTVLVLAAGVSLILLFSCFKDPDSTRRVFLAFFIFSAASLSHYFFAFYFLVLLIGCAQMRVFTPRGLTAAVLGLVTPWWILLGLGIISPSEMRMPEFFSIFSEIDFDDAFLLLTVVLVTVILLVSAFILNARTTIAYNSRIRSYNGLLGVVTLSTMLAMCADYGSIVSYIPLLNFCAAYHIGHYFSAHRSEKSYIAVLSIMALYICFFICQTLI